MATSTRRTARRTTAITLAIAVVATLGGAPAAQGSSSATSTGSAIILQATNNYRADVGQPPLARAGLIDNVAQSWAERMLADRDMRHNPNYSSQMPRTGLTRTGENVAFACGYGGAANTAQVLMTGWYNSTGHRNNMLNSGFTHIGIGFAYSSSSDCGYAVQNFGGYNQRFFDVPRSHQFHNQIDWLARSGITTGYASGRFQPKDNVSREAFAAFMYRMAGRPNVSLPSRSPFPDVPTNSQFYREIVWLDRSGITTGWADGTFRPKERISREAIAAFLYRYEGRPGGNATYATKFRDINSNSKFLREISWLAQSGITTGYADNTFRPKSPVTREATAAFLQRAS